jgi:hypothetical protein
MPAAGAPAGAAASGFPIQAVGVDILPEEMDHLVSPVYQGGRFSENLMGGTGNLSSPGVGDGAEAAEFVATVLDGNISFKVGAVAGRDTPESCFFIG